MFTRLASALLLRRLSRDLSAVAAALDVQNALLARLADHFAPLDPTTERLFVAQETGVDHFDAQEGALAAEFVARTQRDTGHVPDDEEVLTYLADEKTRDLAQRLSVRDQELERLTRERAW